MKKLFQKYYTAALALPCLLLLYGCDDFVDTDQPNSQLVAPAVFEDAATATAAVTDIYAQMRENGMLTGRIGGLSSLLGAYSDELVSYESGLYTTEGFYANSLLASNSYIASIWNASYSQIYAANAVLEGLDSSQVLPQEARDHLKGEALFIRAFLHLQLVSVFGDVPYVETTDYSQNRIVPRTEAAMVHQKIIGDLETAVALLDPIYRQEGRIRPNRSAAQALLARAYLYHGDYANAMDMASAVLEQGTYYTLEQDIDQEFLKDSSSTIWQFAPGYASVNTYEGTFFIFLAGPPSKISLSPGLVASFEEGDLRGSHWIKEVANDGGIWHHAYKYKQDNATSSSVEYSIVLRLAEQYLIRAEARARQGELAGAREDLNKIRQRAGLSDTGAATASELLTEILRERRAEFFTEFGHRFLDLKRYGLLDAALGAKPGWSSTDQLWPLPQSEMNANPFLVPQNPGY